MPLTLAALALPGSSAAQPAPLRDPTEPPAAFRTKPSRTGHPVDAITPAHLVTVDAQRYLVWMGRRYAVGDSVDGARIERVEETEVWLRKDGELRKLPVFAGVEKTTPGKKGAGP